MSSLRLNVRMSRDALSIPWGFRLQGGRDLNQPLTVQRVFFNSPAEGELQRGDVILSVNGRDTSQLTHVQALDLIKHSSGQLQLVIDRPPPGSQGDPLSPPVGVQSPQALSFQSPTMSNPTSRIIPIQMAEPSFVSSQDGPYQQTSHKPPHQPLHVYAVPGPQYQQGFERHRTSYSQPPSTPTPTTPVPPWAAQQFAPKRVSKLSKLGGGGFDFGTVYATLPRGNLSQANYGGRTYAMSQSSFDGPEEQETDRLATGPIPKVCRLRDLGGGGYNFGSSYGAATLPRRGTGRRLSQPVKMPSAANFGYQQSKTPTGRYGGGGLDFGSDYVHRGQGQAQAGRVQTTLDNINISPRSYEVNATNQFYGSSYQPSQQVYTPTGLLLEQQRLQEQQEEGETILPVWQRRKQFQQGPGQNSAVRTPPSKQAPRIPKPRPGPTTYASFGTDYGRSSSKQSTTTWRPENQFKPAPVPVEATPSATYTPVSVQYAPRPAPPSAGPKPSPPTPSYVPAQATPPTWQRQEQQETGTPAWRTSLKSTGVKPWDVDTSYAAEQQQQQQQQQPVRKNKPPPPAVAPKPQHSPVQVQQPQYSPVQVQQPQYSPVQVQQPQYSPVQQPYQGYYEEIGASDF